GRRERTTGETPGQRLARDELHDDCQAVGSLEHIEDRRDVGMGERGRGTRLAEYAASGTLILHGRAGQPLDGDIPSKAFIVRAKHLAHPPRAEHLENAVGPDTVAWP